MINPEEFLRLHPVKMEAAPDESVPLSPSAAKDSPTSNDPTMAEILDASAQQESGRLYERCMASALKSLDAAGATVEGLRKRLISKDFDANTVERVLTTLVRMKLLDDDAFAESFLNRCLGKMMGPMGVRREMMHRGIGADVASRLIQQAVDDGRFEESAEQLVESVSRKTIGMEYQKRMRRLAGAAQRKGHSMTQIRELARDHFAR